MYYFKALTPSLELITDYIHKQARVYNICTHLDFEAPRGSITKWNSYTFRIN